MAESTTPMARDHRPSSTFGLILSSGVAVTYHPPRGEPLRGILSLNNEILRWRSKELLPFFQVKEAIVFMSSVTSVRPGRQTTTFLRTSKYIKPIELMASDDKCISLMHTVASDDATTHSFDIEFKSPLLCEEALAYLTDVKQIPSETVDASAVPLPQGRSVFCQRLYSHPTFGHAILACIVINIVTMSMESPVESDKSFLLAMYALDTVFAIIFTVEQIVKIIAVEGVRPLFHDNWDIADFLIISTTWLSCIPTFSAWNMSAFRSFRALRSLRFFKGLSEFFDTFLKTLPMVVNALSCFGYFLFLFTVLGMYLFSEALTYRCAVEGIDGTVVEVIPTTYCRPGDDSTCLVGHECRPMLSPNGGYTGFHSFEAAFLTVFMISSRAGFGSSFDATVQTKSSFSVLYFLALIIFVSFMIPSLFIAIVRNCFTCVAVKHPSSHKSELQLKMNIYKLKQRPQMPPPTNHIPNVVQYATKRVVQAVKSFLDATSHQTRSLSTQDGNNSSATADDTTSSSLAFGDDDGGGIGSEPPRSIRVVNENAVMVFFLFPSDGRVVRWFEFVCRSATFELIVNFLVLLNALLLTMEQASAHEPPDWYEDRVALVDHSFTMIFSAEVFCRVLTDHGLWPYLQDPWNRFDCAIVCGALVNFVAKSKSVYAPAQERVAFIFRMFRFLRPFRMLHTHNPLLKIVEAILSSLASLFDLVLFMLLGNVVFAILGMNLYGGKFPPGRTHFDTFGDAMLTLFKISSGHGTWSIFYDALHTTSGAIATTYFLSYTVFSVYITLNFMVVILLKKFSVTEDEKRKQLCDQFKQSLEQAMAAYPDTNEEAFVHEFVKVFPTETMHVTLPQQSPGKPKLEDTAAPSPRKKLSPWTRTLRRPLTGPKPKSGSAVLPFSSHVLRKATAILRPPSYEPVGHDCSTGEANPDGPPHRQAPQPSLPVWSWLYNDVSLFVFGPDSEIRKTCAELESKTETFIWVCIVIRSALITLQSPLYSNTIQQFTNLIEWLFMLVLLFEFTIKIVGKGFAFTPNAYLNDPWNQMNVVVLLACILLLLIPHSDLSEYFHLGRAFGPVRVIRGMKSFSVIMNALMSSLHQVVWCVVVTCFGFVVFALIGQQLFAGKFESCNDRSPSIITYVDCVGVFIHPVTNTLMPRVWGHVKGIHFDTFGGALGTLFSVVSKKAWIGVMYTAMDIVGEGHQPREDASKYFAFFFVAFVFLSRFYMLRVFAGVIVNNFRAHNGTILLSNRQLIWLRNKRRIVALHPQYPAPSTTTMKLVYEVVKHPTFKALSSIAVLTHVTILALSDANSPKIWVAHHFFTIVYGTEAALTVMSMGIREFLTRGWSSEGLNACLVICMVMGPHMTSSTSVLVLGVLRAFDFNHLTLVLEPFPNFRGLSSLFQTILESTRAMVKLTLLLGYVMFIYANLGMQLFSLTKWGVGLDGNLNFSTFPRAFAAFIKFAAGEDWSDAYRACSVAPPNCVYRVGSEKSDCGSKGLSTIFYYSYFVLVFLILQNFFVAVVLDTYVSTSAMLSESDSLNKVGFNVNHLQAFRSIWSRCDVQALGYMSRRKLLWFLKELNPPLGLNTGRDASDPLDKRFMDTDGMAIYVEVMARLDELTHRRHLLRGERYEDKMIRFKDLLLILTQRTVPCEGLTISEKVIELSTRHYIDRYRAAIKIQKTFRGSLVATRKRRRRGSSTNAPGGQSDGQSYHYYRHVSQLVG
ncbi:hypothetical protein H310_03920 [Aphanomyces invadans]|uniref:Ion transport domain-containing protein n=1 Tax=Aphanomyces invadans TaxID=157072 RepID=A0A024UEF2_9STRA|nr:hypothetical protein H310_03920 [Aphanomyces invadans]ETW04781.1 hypothetical protein H310_03920 [Aphanomyces invadans]RHY31903.1 hypothetical protein DYB32_003065 [Aphanomyces invadans]|eukprot:XP_008866219.1 hypothetical protein H310_03920 [Aphanomyces invadans]